MAAQAGSGLPTPSGTRRAAIVTHKWNGLRLSITHPAHAQGCPWCPPDDTPLGDRKKARPRGAADRREAELALVRIVRKRPGLTTSELYALSKAKWWSEFYRDVRRLVETRRLVQLSSGRATIFFLPKNLPPKDVLEAISFLRSAGAVSLGIARTIVASPGTDIHSLAQHNKLSCRAVYHHLKRLTQARLIILDDHGPRRKYAAVKASPVLVSALERMPVARRAK